MEEFILIKHIIE